MNSATVSFRLQHWILWVLANTLIMTIYSLPLAGFLGFGIAYAILDLYIFIPPLLQACALWKSGISPSKWGIATFMGIHLTIAASRISLALEGPSAYQPNVQLLFIQRLSSSLWQGALFGAILGGVQTIALLWRKSFCSVKNRRALLWIPASMLACALGVLPSFWINWLFLGPEPLPAGSNQPLVITLNILSGTIYGIATAPALALILRKAGYSSPSIENHE